MRLTLFSVLALAPVFGTGCGAAIQAVYEAVIKPLSEDKGGTSAAAAEPPVVFKCGDGAPDDGVVIVVDNGVDVDGDRKFDEVAHQDTADGLMLFDRDLGGEFAEAAEDEVDIQPMVTRTLASPYKVG